MNSPLPAPSSRAASLAATLEGIIPLYRLRDRSLLADVAARWSERQRVWHGLGHLLRMLEEIGAMPAGDDRDILSLTALYHDAIYDPRAPDNEERSAALLQTHAADPSSAIVTKATEIYDLADAPDSPSKP